MDMAAVAHVADIVAALGVIASLLFLAFQIRQNTRTIRNQHWESHLNRLADCFARPVDAEIARVIVAGQTDYDALDRAQKIMFNGWASEYLANVVGSIGFHRQGILDAERAVMGERRLKWFFAHEGTRRWWRDPTRHPVPADYERLIDEVLRDFAAADA